jgi:hypothetical protein
LHMAQAFRLNKMEASIELSLGGSTVCKKVQLHKGQIDWSNTTRTQFKLNRCT